MQIRAALTYGMLTIGSLSCGSSTRAPIIPCECPATWWSQPITVTLTPVPASASISIASNESGVAAVWIGPDPAPNSPSSRASCTSAEQCSQVQLGVGYATYNVTVDAPAYQSVTTPFTFTEVPSSCCPGITPRSVAISLTPN